MTPHLLALFGFLGLLLLLIAVTELLHRRFKWPAEQSRKFLHVSGGLICLLLPSFFDSHWWVLILAGTSFLLLFVTYQKRLLNSIHRTKRYSVGSVIFPIPVYLCYLGAEQFNNDMLYYLPVSLLAVSDTAAETAGNRWGHLSRQYFNKQKTLVGTAAFFITAMPVCLLWCCLCQLSLSETLLICGTIPIVTAITELVTLHGWDNLTVPIVTDLLLWMVFG